MRKKNIVSKMIFLLVFFTNNFSSFGQFSDFRYDIKNTTDQLKLIQIDTLANSTLLFMNYQTDGWLDPFGNFYNTTYIDENTVIKANNKEYRLLNTINLAISTPAEQKNILIPGKEINHNFILEFERFPLNEPFDLFENDKDCDAFNLYNITYQKNNSERIQIDSFISKTNNIFEEGTFADNGNFIRYLKGNGFIIYYYVEAVKEYGRYFKVYIDIQNLSGKSILFDTDMISAYVYRVNKSKSKDQFEPLKIYSSKEFDKRVSRKQMWEEIARGFASGMAASQVGYPYAMPYGYSNSAMRYLATEVATHNMRELDKEHYQIRETIRDGYVKTHTLKNECEYSGFFYIEYKKNAELLYLDIDIDGSHYLLRY